MAIKMAKVPGWHFDKSFPMQTRRFNQSGAFVWERLRANPVKLIQAGQSFDKAPNALAEQRRECALRGAVVHVS